VALGWELWEAPARFIFWTTRNFYFLKNHDKVDVTFEVVTIHFSITL